MASKLTAANIRKAIVAGVGVVATVANLGLVHGTAETVLQVIIAAATAAGVYAVPNRVGPAPARPSSVL